MAGLFDDILQAQPQGAQAPVGGLFSDIIDAKPQEKPGMMADVGKSAGSGLVSGLVGMASMPADLGNLAMVGGMKGAAYLKRLAGFEDSAKATEAELARMQQANQALGVLPGNRPAAQNAEAIASVAPDALNPLYKPQTTLGRYTKTTTELAPAAVIGPSGMVRNAAGAVLGGALSETAGHALEGTPYEGPARAVGAIVGMGAPSVVRTSTSTAIERAMRGLNQADVANAEAIMQRAAERGVRLSWDEALAQATNGRGQMTALRRVVENSEGGAPLKEMMANRHAEVDAAGRAAIDQIGPSNAAPSSIGPAVGRAADNTISDVQGAINRTTRQLYDQADPQRVGLQVHNALVSDPIYARTLQEIRNNPELNATIANLPDDSVGVIDLVQRRMRERADTLATPGQAHSSNLAASNVSQARDVPIAAAEAATGSVGGNVGSYEAARATQAALRERYLQPLMDGPIGKLAGEPTTQRAIETLFPSNPLPASEREVSTAVSAVARRNPNAARDLVRAHVESVFNEATQNLQAGANLKGGANFVKDLVGNSQQGRNLEAAVRALPNGDRVWNGFTRLFETLEATGKAPNMGSNTAPDLGTRKLLQEGHGIEALLKFGQVTKDAVERARLGRNISVVADILANPRSAGLLAELARAPRGSSKALVIAGRVLARSNAAQTRSNPVTQAE